MMIFSLEYCWIFTFLVLHMWDIGCEGQRYTIATSTEVTAQVGLCAYIPCTFTRPSNVKINQCLWYKINQGRKIVASTKNNPSSRIFFTGDVEAGVCSLIINDIVKNDAAPYLFRLEAVIPRNSNSYDTQPKVTVTDLKDKPDISVGTLVAGKEATLTCRSPGVCAGTAPDFTWTEKAGVISNYNNSYLNRTSIYFSNLTFTPSSKDNGVTLGCRVSFLPKTATTEQTIKLNVEYPPDVIITFRGSKENVFTIKEGDSGQINCTVDSNPTGEITWFMGDEKKGEIKGQWLIYNLTNISLSDAGKYSCTGKNHLGSAEKTIDVIVNYPPRTPNINCVTTEVCSIEEEHTIYIMEDTTSTLACTAESLPKASLSWKTPDPKTTYSVADGHLTFNKVSLSDEGKFTCEASNIYGMSNSSIIIKVTAQVQNNTGIIAGVSCVVVIVLLLSGGFLVVHYFRKKNLSEKPEDKKVVNADGSSVICSNPEVHIYGNQTEEIGTNSVYSELDDNNSSLYMNVDDIHYATIDFSKLKPSNAEKNAEIDYAEIKK